MICLAISFITIIRFYFYHLNFIIDFILNTEKEEKKNYFVG